MRRIPTLTVALVLTWALPAPARADVRPHGLFTEGMVLQQGMRVPVWGYATPGEKVTVSIQGQALTTIANAAGTWQVVLLPLRPGGPYQFSMVGNNAVVFNNVLVGEVWVCSGQSNMEWPLWATSGAAAALTQANVPSLRLFSVPKVSAAVPQGDLPTVVPANTWQQCTPATANNFSAVAYYFGCHLVQSRQVPIGLIQCAYSGTSAENWVSQQALLASPLTSGLQGTGLFNGMISPLMPFAIRGVIWYQGESNVGRALQYRTLFPALIADWRARWGQGNFPFLFVQLAPYGGYATPTAWAELCEAQFLTSLNAPMTPMAVTDDLGVINNMHPPNKAPVGVRLGLAARAIAYGEKIAFSGPICTSMLTQGSQVTLQFSQTTGGLAASGGTLNGFTVAGADGNFVPASAVIRGTTVVVSSASVPRPVAVRYGWSNFPTMNLYNGFGLPASPFRTDVPNAMGPSPVQQLTPPAPPAPVLALRSPPAAPPKPARKAPPTGSGNTSKPGASGPAGTQSQLPGAAPPKGAAPPSAAPAPQDPSAPTTAKKHPPTPTPAAPQPQGQASAPANPRPQAKTPPSPAAHPKIHRATAGGAPPRGAAPAPAAPRPSVQVAAHPPVVQPAPHVGMPPGNMPMFPAMYLYYRQMYGYPRMYVPGPQMMMPYGPYHLQAVPHHLQGPAGFIR